MKQKKIQFNQQIFVIVKEQIVSLFRKKLVVFGMLVIPVTSVGAGMNIYIENDVMNVEQKPIMANETVINLDEQIIIYFTTPINNTMKYEKLISTYPQTNLMFDWNEKNTIVRITPRTIWKPKTQYSIAFPFNSYESTTEMDTIFSFETVAYPEVINDNLNNYDAKYIKEGENILIAFDEDISSFDIDVVIRPVLDTTQNFDVENRMLQIHINDIAQDDKGTHTMTIFVKHKKQTEAQFFPIATETFNVFVQKPEIYPEEHKSRLEAAKISTIPQILKGKYIDINLEAQVTTLFDNGKFVANFISSSGAEETPTPKGEFHIFNKHPYALSGMFNVYLPYWMAFTEDGEYGLHGLIVWPEGHEDKVPGTKESEQNIGNAVSAGCVRHDDENAKFLYDWADIGTIIKIY
jgi:lipoprotein-anchoring transpeptidase ErfK/SrfK